MCACAREGQLYVFLQLKISISYSLFSMVIRYFRRGDKTTRHFSENDPSFKWKQPVILVKITRHFCENDPLFRDVRCVVLSKKFLWFFWEGNKKTEPSSDSVFCLLSSKKGATILVLWKKYRTNAVLSILCSVVWKWAFNPNRSLECDSVTCDWRDNFLSSFIFLLTLCLFFVPDVACYRF